MWPLLRVFPCLCGCRENLFFFFPIVELASIASGLFGYNENGTNRRLPVVRLRSDSAAGAVIGPSEGRAEAGR